VDQLLRNDFVLVWNASLFRIGK